MVRYLAGGVVVLALAVGARAQDKAEDRMHNDAPGLVHKQLAKCVGEYTTATKFFMTPGEKPQETHGRASLTMVLGGRFLHEHSQGKMFGRDFQSVHLTGYNNSSKQYEGLWLYTGSTALMNLTGTSNDDGKTVECTATVDMGNGHKMTMAINTRHIDDDHFVVELISKTPDGSKGPTLETTYTRVKGHSKRQAAD